MVLVQMDLGAPEKNYSNAAYFQTKWVTKKKNERHPEKKKNKHCEGFDDLFVVKTYVTVPSAPIDIGLVESEREIRRRRQVVFCLYIHIYQIAHILMCIRWLFKGIQAEKSLCGHVWTVRIWLFSFEILRVNSLSQDQITLVLSEDIHTETITLYTHRYFRHNEVNSYFRPIIQKVSYLSK